jgi:hypothetical protein
MRQPILFYIIICCLVVAGRGTSWAKPFNADGFTAAKRLETSYFTVFMAPGVDEAMLMKGLDVRLPSERPDQAAVHSLGAMLDGFYEWASNVLEMQVAGYHGQIKVVQNERRLQDIFLRLYGIKSPPYKGFYVPEERTLYVAAPDFTKEVMAHELGHVVVSNYFVVQPSEKAAEVLAGYVEFQLRKMNAAQRQKNTAVLSFGEKLFSLYFPRPLR